MLDTHENDKVAERIDQISKHFRMSELKLPAIYGMKNVIADIQSTEQMTARLKEILTLTAYIRNGCPHCRDAKAFLEKYGSRYPALEIVYKEVITSQTANREMQTVVSRYQQRAASLPVLHFCNGISIGYDRDTTTGRKILQTLDYWSRACEVKKKITDSSHASDSSLRHRTEHQSSKSLTQQSLLDLFYTETQTVSFEEFHDDRLNPRTCLLVDL